MSKTRHLSADELTARTARFYSRYSRDLEQIRDMLTIRLQQLALAYTIQNKLPPEAIVISSRVKSQASFIRNLSEKNGLNFTILQKSLKICLELGLYVGLSMTA